MASPHSSESESSSAEIESQEDLFPCDRKCWIKASWDRPMKTSDPYVIEEHPPATKEVMQRTAEKLYKPIRFYQFRILKLWKGSTGTPLECTLHTATVAHLQQVVVEENGEPAEYEALSYSWGYPEFVVAIKCNRLTVYTTRHLAEALLHLRLPDRDRWLWTDAFCINQHNLVEKGQQVQLMYTIFKNASNVVGWLGRVPAEQYQLLSYFEAYNETIQEVELPETRELSEHTIRSLQKATHHGGDDKTIKGDSKCRRIQRDLEGLCSDFILSTEWFARTWIRQEIFAATNLLFQMGPYKFQLRAFKSTPIRPKMRMLDILLAAGTTRSNQPIPPWLDVVLQNTEGFRTTMDHDIIFGLQNIVEGERRAQDRLLPVADYTKPSHAIFQDWSKRLMNEIRLPYFLFIFEDRSKSTTSDLPSWLPDLRVKKHRALFIDDAFDTPDSYKFTCDPSVENSALYLEGAVLATIDTRHQPVAVRLSPKIFISSVQYAARDKTASSVQDIAGLQLNSLLEELNYIIYTGPIRELDHCATFIPSAAKTGDLLVTPTPSSIVFFLLRPLRPRTQGQPLRCRFVGPCLGFGTTFVTTSSSLSGFFSAYRHTFKKDAQEFELL